MPRSISSLTNPRIKNVVRLRDRKHREKTGLTIVEGNREIERALTAGVEINEIYICPELFNRHADEAFTGKLMSADATVTEVTKKVFGKIAYGGRQEGALAVCEIKSTSFYDMALNADPLVVVVEGVEKPGNLGAIFRSCDGAGVDGVIICDENTDLFNPNVIRASLGTVFSVKGVVSTNDDALHFLKGKNFKIVAAVTDAEKVYTDLDLRGSVAIAVGSEEKGLSPFWRQHADQRVRIPMKGMADSLNVSASAAVLIYESVRQRG